jgi:hypothetical protein
MRPCNGLDIRCGFLYESQCMLIGIDIRAYYKNGFEMLEIEFLKYLGVFDIPQECIQVLLL